jgi:hypothetical protein
MTGWLGWESKGSGMGFGSPDRLDGMRVDGWESGSTMRYIGSLRGCVTRQKWEEARVKRASVAVHVHRLPEILAMVIFMWIDNS